MNAKNVTVYIIIAFIAVTGYAVYASTIYPTQPAPEAKHVNLINLELKVLTDKKEYRVNEPIKTSLYVYNNNSYPVTIEPVRTILIHGPSTTGNVSALVNVDYAVDYKYVYLEANSRQLIFTQEFVSSQPREFTIMLLSATTNVKVTT